MSRCRSLPQIPVVSVVDDDESVRVSVAALIRSLGHQAHAFGSAEDFLASTAAEATDCLVVDIQMPGMSGLELQQTLATSGRWIPIIFVTAFLEDRIKKQVLAAGALGLLGKPYDGDALVNLIESALPDRS